MQSTHDTNHVKAASEFAYWAARHDKEGTLQHAHYGYFFTTHFGLDRAVYRGKRVLDVGCGPRGSLEWADEAAERVGLDPLIDAYRQLGIAAHKMSYVAAPAESIPFPDGYFDIVSSFNSLDHVDDLDRSIAEIIRVLAPGGLFLLLTDVNHPPTPCEPLTLTWDLVDRFQPALTLLESAHFEKLHGGMYQSVHHRIPYDHGDERRRYGILSAKFLKMETPSAVDTSNREQGL